MNPLLVDAEKYVFKILNKELHTSYVYHNISHTQNVIEKTIEISEGLKLDEVSKENLQLAACFHDTGFIKGAKNHEEESVKILTKYLKEKDFDVKRIALISKLILSTKIGYKPSNELEKIIIDADCAHLGSKGFEDRLELLRKEWETICEQTYSDADWLTLNIDFFTKSHVFYTDYALKKWSKGKDKNLTKLLKNQKKLKEDLEKLQQKKDALEFKKSKNEVPERGVETMFRVALKNHMTLSNIADTKANILLSVNAIIVSLTMSNLIPKLDKPSNSYLIIPTVIFVIFTVTSIVLSILATRPNITRGQFTKEDVANKKVNLLFFGNFHQMKLPDFEWGIKEMMQDKEYLYGSLTKDLYFLGLVLNRKYKILRVTYAVFMTGIIVTAIAFAVTFKAQA